MCRITTAPSQDRIAADYDSVIELMKRLTPNPWRFCQTDRRRSKGANAKRPVLPIQTSANGARHVSNTECITAAKLSLSWFTGVPTPPLYGLTSEKFAPPHEE
jgi:hypothetical protein